MLKVTWVSVFTEGSNCSPLRDRSLAKRNIHMSFANLEKRFQRPQVKDYVTIDIYKKNLAVPSWVQCCG